MNRMPAKKRIGPLSGQAPTPVGAPRADTKQDLQRRLAGSQWEWTGGGLTLKHDGTAELPRSGAGELAARWEAIDRRTAVLLIERGRADDRLAVLQFSEELGELGGYGFDGRRLFTRKRLDAGAAPLPAGSPKSPPFGVAVLPIGRDYLFFRHADPALYRTEGGSASKVRELGRHAAAIRALATAPDGSR